jgi:hypothetical protein
MGEIRQEVRDLHLNQFRNDESVLNAFTTGFNVNWGRRRIAYNTQLSVFFLAPERFMAETFGLQAGLSKRTTVWRVPPSHGRRHGENLHEASQTTKDRG